MRYLLLYIELFICVTCAWMISFRLTVTIDLPVYAAFIVFFALLIPFLLLLYTKSWRTHIAHISRPTRWFIYGVLGIAILVGIFVLFVARPDFDDTGYLHFVLNEVQSFDMQVKGLEFELPGATVAINYERLFPHEAFIVLFSKIAGIDPLGAYHNIGAFIATITWAITYAIFFRQIGLRRKEVLFALTATIIFLLIDGNLHQSFGNFAFVRIWQGKVIQFAVIIPLATVLSLRFLQKPSAKNFLLLFMTFICLAEYGRSGIFLAPILVFAIASATIFTFGFRPHYGKRAILLIGTAIYPLLLGVAIFLTAIIPTVENIVNASPSLKTEIPDYHALVNADNQLSNIVSSYENYPGNWFENLYETTIGSPGVFIRNLFLLLILPFFVLPKPYNRLIPLITVALILLVANPLTGQLIISMVGNQSYWRISYLFPVPLCAGLVVMFLHTYRTQQQQITAGIVSIVAVILVALAFRSSVFDPEYVFVKSPVQYRLRQNEVSFVDSIIDDIRGMDVLASEPVAVVLTLTHYNDLGSLAYIRKSLRGNTKVSWMENVITHCNPDPGGRSYDALKNMISARPELDALIIASCEENIFRSILETLGNNWFVAEKGDNYSLLLHQSQNPE